MAFEGDLSHLALGDVLQTLAMSRQQGTFLVRGPEERRLLVGENGVGLVAARNSLKERVCAYLVGRGYATPGDVDLALKTQRRRRDACLEDLLLEANAVTEKTIREARRYAAAEEIHDIFLWREGRFEFVAAEEPLPDSWGSVWFDVASLSMEAARRIDEIPRLAEMAPLEEVLLRTEAGVPIPQIDGIGSDVERLLAFVDGTRTVGGILTEFHLGRFDTWKVLAVLCEVGLLRPAAREELVDAAGRLSREKHYLLAAAILRRLVADDPSDRDARASLVQALVSGGERRAAAVEWVTLGRADLAGHDGRAAAECFRQATRLDPGGADAHEGLARALMASNDREGAAEAVRQAASIRLDGGDHEGAAAVAEFGILEFPEDIGVRLLLANARIAAGDPAEGLRVLYDAASLLESTKGDERRLVEIYRRILQLDPERRDCAKRVAELEVVQTGRKKLYQRLSVGVGLALLAFVAVPILARPGAAGRIGAAHTLLAGGDLAGAREIAQELSGHDLDEDELSLLQDLQSAIERRADDEASRSAGPSRALAARVAAVLGRASADPAEDLAKSLATHEECLAVLESPEAKALAVSHAAALASIRKDAAAEFHGTLRLVAEEAVDASLKVTQARDKFTADAFRREIPEQLETLVRLADGVQEVLAGQDWKDVAKRLETLQARAGRTATEDERKALAAIRVVLDSGPEVQKDGERALASLRKRRLLDQILTTHGRGHQLLSEGNVEEAAEVYRSFLEACNAMRSYEPRELYDPIVRDYLDAQERHRPAEQRLEEIEIVLAAEERAIRAIEDGDVATAFKVRAELVRSHPRIDFRERFFLPLRIESRPEGAVATLFDSKNAEGRRLGTTPLPHVDYFIEGPTRIELRMTGFEDALVERFGAEQDSDGVVLVEMTKRPDLVAPTGGRIQAPPALAGGRIYTAGRDGIVRALSAETGKELVRNETGLLGGFAGAPVIRDGKVWVATLDGLALLLDATTLRELRRVQLDGPARASPLSVPFGVVVADESGVVRCLDTALGTLWRQKFGKIVSDPVLSGNTVAVVTLDSELILLSASDGTVAARIRLPDDPRWGTPFASAGKLWLGGDALHVACVDVASRRIEWCVEVDGPVRARPARVGDRLVVATARGGVLTLDASTGKELSRMLAGAPISGGALPLADGFAVATDRGLVIRFDVDGRTHWRFDAHDDLAAPPTLLEGRIHLVTRKGAIVVLTP